MSLHLFILLQSKFILKNATHAVLWAVNQLIPHGKATFPLGRRHNRLPTLANALFSIPLLVLGLLFATLQAEAQTISGSVFASSCSKVGGGGLAITVTLPNGTALSVPVNLNGSWSFTIPEGAPEGTYTFTLNGGTPVAGYTLIKGAPNVIGANFTLMPPPIPDLTVNNTPINMNSPAQFYTCQMGLPPNYGLNFFGISSSAIVFGGQEFFCWRTLIYLADDLGNHSNPPIHITEWQNSFRPPQAFWFKLGSGRNYVVELQRKCCQDTGEEAIVSRKGWFKYSSLSTADVNFTYMATNTVENINNDSPINGKIARSETHPGPQLGRYSIGMDASPTSGNNIQNYQYKIFELNCSNGQFIQPAIYTSPVIVPQGGILSDNIPFLDLPIGDNDPVTPPFFTVPANTTGKCFAMTLDVTNPCGTVTATGYFTITTQCNFCLGTPGGEGEEPGMKHIGAILREDGYLDNMATKVSAFPNPGNTSVALAFSVETDNELVNLEIVEIASGRVVSKPIASEQLEKGEHLHLLDVSSFTPGLYQYRLSVGKTVVAGKFAKN